MLENFGKNPEYLRYSAAHSTIILQNTNISEIKKAILILNLILIFNKETNVDNESLRAHIMDI